LLHLILIGYSVQSFIVTLFYQIGLDETQYKNPVMSVKLKITRFWKWSQSFEYVFFIEVFRSRI